MSKSYRIFVLILVLGFLGWLGLVLIERQFRLGRFAENPQHVELLPGRRAIVGGGRAVLGFVGPEKKEVKLEIGCAEEKIVTEVSQNAASEEICGRLGSEP